MSVLQSSAASHPDNVCLPASRLSQLTHGDDPEAFLWVCEGLAVACGLPEEEAGREQPSSDCSPRATLLYWQKTMLHLLHPVLCHIIGLHLLGVLGDVRQFGHHCVNLYF